MQLIAERSQAITGADGAMVNLIDGEMLHTRAVSGIAVGRVRRAPPARRARVAKYAIESGQPLLIEDAPNDPRINQELRAKVGDESLICVPLFRGGEVIGTLNVMSRSKTNRLNEDQRQTLEILSVVLSAAVSRAAEFEARRGQAEALARFRTLFDGRLDRDPPARPRRPRRRGEPGARADARLHRRGARRARPRATTCTPSDCQRAEVLFRDLTLGPARVVPARGAVLAQGRRARLGPGERRARARPGRPAGLRRHDDREHHQAETRRGGADPPGGAERAPGAPRPAHRPAEPAAVRRPHRAGDRPGRARRHAGSRS